MQTNSFSIIILISILILSIDFYTFRGIKKLKQNLSKLSQKIITLLYWVVPILLLIGLIFFLFFYRGINPTSTLRYFHYISGFFFLFYIPKFVFILFNFIDDIILFSKRVLMRKNKTKEEIEGENISRRKFLLKAGIALSTVPFASILYGIAIGRFNFEVRNLKLKFSNLPDAFNGFKLLQISDLHLGSFIGNEEEIRKAVNLINNQKADLIVFTGDLVNNIAEETENFIDILSSLKSNYGVYSILGNHDYGEYVRWQSAEAKKNNLKKLKEIQKEMGFKLLLNENIKLVKDEEHIEFIGVENWGLPPFPQYGNLDKALLGTDENSFKILLSHDPTHWDEKVFGKKNIDLTLSGHTHGAQFGVKIPGYKKWSPVKVRYKRWGGLYSERKQKLYVNTGLGFIGFPGRVGMPPEITVINLYNNNA